MGVEIDSANVLTNGANAGTNPLSVGTLTVSEGVNFVLVIVAQDSTAGTDTATVNGVSATLWTPNPDDAGGYADISVLYLANPTSGNVSVNLGASRIKSVAVVPLSGVDTTDPLGTWLTPGASYVTNPSTGIITGVDSSGLFIGALAITGTALVSSDGSFSSVADRIQDSDIRVHVASAAGGASATYAPTLSAQSIVNPIGVYVKASAASAPSKSLGLLLRGCG